MLLGIYRLQKKHTTAILSYPRRPPAFQVYILSDGSSRGPLDLALRLGVGALVITVDANAPRHGALHRATAQSTGVFPSHSFNWEELKELRKTFPVSGPRPKGEKSWEVEVVVWFFIVFFVPGKDKYSTDFVW